MHYVSSKEMWDKIQKNYEGDDKVKKENYKHIEEYMRTLR
jgi:hypothetical protein